MAQNFAPFTLPPGIVKPASNALAQGRWNDANFVRWVDGRLAPVAGWEKLALTGTFASKIRQILTWSDNSGIIRTAILCEANLYYVDVGGVINDITPAGGMTAPTGNVTAGGYGDDVYGAYTYGDARPNKTNYKAIGPCYTLANWGQSLVAMTSPDGRLLIWDPSSAPGTKAAAVANAPTNNRTFVVTPERHVIIFGSGNVPNQFSWCDQENITVWGAGVTNTAGSYLIEPFSPILAAQVIKNGVVFFTATAAYLSRYIGVPFIYDYELISETSAPITTASLSEYGGVAYWLADDGFWSSDGISISSVDCDILEWYKLLADPLYSRYRTAATNLGSQTEIWWFFPDNTTGGENNRVIIYNPIQKWWSIGVLSRSCGYKAAYNTYPIMSDGTSLYKHESGLSYADLATLPYAESGALNTSGGARMTYVDAWLVDHNAPYNAVQYTVKGYINRLSQASGPEITIGPKFCRADGVLESRLTARDITIKIQTAINGGPSWTFGQPLVAAAPRGTR